MERNLRLIPVHTALAQAFVWIPVFVLFTRARFDLDGAVLLSSIYYLGVVVFEVPSGWASDRLGRVVTLRAAAVAWIGAQTCFLVGDHHFAVVAAGQVLLAVGFASLSGTDVTFHYDTLEAVGRADAYGARQASVAALGFLATALSALVGGAVGLIDVRLAFALSLFLALAQLGVAARLREPPGHRRPEGRWQQQLVDCVRYLRWRTMGWIFFYGILLVTLEHVAFTLLQPWLTEVLGRPADDLGATPLLAGIVFAATSVVGAGAARSTPALTRRFGPVMVLIGLAAVSAGVVTVMAASTALAAVAVVLLRSAQTAAAPVIISAQVAPVVAREHRATLLSLNSLTGRLGWGLILAGVSSVIADDVGRTLRIFTVVSWGLVAVLVTSALVLRPDRGTVSVS